MSLRMRSFRLLLSQTYWNTSRIDTASASTATDKTGAVCKRSLAWLAHQQNRFRSDNQIGSWHFFLGNPIEPGRLTSWCRYSYYIVDYLVECPDKKYACRRASSSSGTLQRSVFYQADRSLRVIWQHLYTYTRHTSEGDTWQRNVSRDLSYLIVSLHPSLPLISLLHCLILHLVTLHVSVSFFFFFSLKWVVSFYFYLFYLFFGLLCRQTCPCCRGSCCIVPGWPNRLQHNTWPNTSSFSWTPMPAHLWIPRRSCWRWMSTARGGPLTGKSAQSHRDGGSGMNDFRSLQEAFF